MTSLPHPILSVAVETFDAPDIYQPRQVVDREAFQLQYSALSATTAAALGGFQVKNYATQALCTTRESYPDER